MKHAPILFAIITLAVRPAHADPVPCAPERLMLDRLASRFHEFVVVTGAEADRQMIITMSKAGTFSVLLTDGKTACLVMAGDKAQLDNGI